MAKTKAEKARIWIRVSSDNDQHEENQLPDCEQHCAAKGYEVINPPYVVHAKSAYHGEQQPMLDKMLGDLRSGQFTVLVIWHSDRIERREGKALLDLLAEVAAAGGRVESTLEPMLGQLDMGSQIMTYLTGLMNHEKSAHLSDQVGLAQERVRKNGALWGRPPFGFTTAGDKKYERYLVATDEGRPGFLRSTS